MQLGTSFRVMQWGFEIWEWRKECRAKGLTKQDIQAIGSWARQSRYLGLGT